MFRNVTYVTPIQYLPSSKHECKIHTSQDQTQAVQLARCDRTTDLHYQPPQARIFEIIAG